MFLLAPSLVFTMICDDIVFSWHCVGDWGGRGLLLPRRTGWGARRHRLPLRVRLSKFDADDTITSSLTSLKHLLSPLLSHNH
jgi:hypothetical protein